MYSRIVYSFRFVPKPELLLTLILKHIRHNSWGISEHSSGRRSAEYASLGRDRALLSTTVPQAKPSLPDDVGALTETTYPFRQQKACHSWLKSGTCFRLHDVPRPRIRGRQPPHLHHLAKAADPKSHYQTAEAIHSHQWLL